MAGVCDTLAGQGLTVRVIADDRGYDDPSTRVRAHEYMDAVEVVRVGFASFGKASLITRLLGAVLFANVILAGILGPR